MLKAAIVASAMIILTGSSIALAQQNSESESSTPDLRGQHSLHGYCPSAADMAAFTDARLAALRAGLQLTPDQAKNWPPFEQALRDAAQLRMQYVQAREASRHEERTPEQDQASANPFARLEQRADNLARISAALKKIADNGTPLYESLTDAQKQRFMILAHMLRPHWMGMAGGMMGRGMMGGGMMRRGMMGHGMMGSGMMRRGMMRGGMMGHGMMEHDMTGDSDQDSEH